jgi:hypothetical protein
VPTVGQFLNRWLEDTVAPNLAPLRYATYESHVKNDDPHIQAHLAPRPADKISMHA